MSVDTSGTETGVRAGRREWLGLAVLALPTLLLSLDMSVLYLALPYLSADLGAGSTQQLWIMDIYGFMIAGFLITMGTLGDRIGDAARESITGAVAAAAQLPDRLGTDLLAGARDAFTDGLNVVAGLSAVLFLVLAVVAAVLFRHVPPRGETEPETAPETENHPGRYAHNVPGSAVESDVMRIRSGSRGAAS